MLADVAYFFMISIVVYTAFQEPNILAKIAWFIFALLALKVWVRQGGFMAWKPSEIKKFMTNAKRMGL